MPDKLPRVTAPLSGVAAIPPAGRGGARHPPTVQWPEFQIVRKILCQLPPMIFFTSSGV